MVDILDINVHNIGAALVIDILYWCALCVHCLTVFTNHERTGS